MFSQIKFSILAIFALGFLSASALWSQSNSGSSWSQSNNNSIDLNRAVFFNQQPQPVENQSSVASPPVVDRTPTQSVDLSYVLSPNDTISITVFAEPDLSATTRVSPQGNVTLPLVGILKLGGRTIQVANELVSKAYKDGYLRNPKVTIAVIEFAKKRFNVLGQVQRPGSYEIPQQEQMTLLQAVAMAGGYTRIANPGEVTVKRISENGKEIILHLDAKVMAQDKNAPVFLIQHNDTITVSESIF